MLIVDDEPMLLDMAQSALASLDSAAFGGKRRHRDRGDVPAASGFHLLCVSRLDHAGHGRLGNCVGFTPTGTSHNGGSIWGAFKQTTPTFHRKLRNPRPT